MNQKPDNKKKLLDTLTEDYGKRADNAFDEFSHIMADELVDEESKKPQQLLPKKAQKERFEQQFNQEYTTLKGRLERGSAQIVQKLMTLSKTDESMFSEEVISDIAKLITLSTTLSTQQAEFIEQIVQEKSLIEIVHVSENTFEKMYQAAKTLYTEKLYPEAADAFGFLTILNSTNYSCWLGLAHAEFYCHNFSEAIFAYAFCCHINPADPDNYIYSSRCYETLKEFDNAINALELALLVVETQPQYSQLKPQLEQEMQRIHTVQEASNAGNMYE